jgi:hypothetical protein
MKRIQFVKVACAVLPLTLALGALLQQPVRATAATSDLRLVGHYGGAVFAVHVWGSYVVSGAGSALRISNQDTLSRIGWVNLPGIVEAIDVAGNFAYVALGDKGFVIVDLSDPRAPRVLSRTQTKGPVTSADDFLKGNAYELRVADDYLFVPTIYDGVKVYDVTNKSSPVLVTQFAQNGEGIELYGRYAYVNEGYWGVSSFDVHDPVRPVAGARLITSSVGDITLDAVHGKLYAASFVGGVLITLDLGAPLSGNWRSSLTIDDHVWTLAVNPAQKVVYATGQAGLHAVNVSNADSPALISTLTDERAGAIEMSITGNQAFIANRSGKLARLNIASPATMSIDREPRGNPGFAQVDAVGTLAYLVHHQQLTIVNTSDPANPRIVGTYIEPNTMYLDTVVVEHSVAYIGGTGVIAAVDVTDVGHPRLLSKVSVEDGSYVGDLHVAGNQLFAGLHGKGFEVYDISDPRDMRLIGSYALGGAHDISTKGPWFYVAGSDDRVGLKVMDASNPELLEVEGTYEGYVTMIKPFPWNWYGYATVFEAGGPSLHVLDLSNPKDVELKGRLEVDFDGKRVSFDDISFLESNQVAYGVGRFAMAIFDVTNPESTRVLQTMELATFGTGVDIVGNTLYVTDYVGGLSIYTENVAVPPTPTATTQVPGATPANPATPPPEATNLPSEEPNRIYMPVLSR